MKWLIIITLLLPSCTVVPENNVFPQFEWAWSSNARAHRQYVKQEKIDSDWLKEIRKP